MQAQWTSLALHSGLRRLAHIRSAKLAQVVAHPPEHPLANCLVCKPPTFLHVPPLTFACKPPTFLHFPSCFATLRHSNLGITTPDFVLRLLHRLQSFALLRFVFSFQSLPSFYQPFDTPTSVSLLIPLQTVLPASLLHSSTFIFCSPSTLQPRFHCSSPCNRLGPNHNGHCSPLTFGSLLFFHLLDSVSSIQVPFGFPAFPS